MNQKPYELQKTPKPKVCKELGIRLVAYSPLCLGVLAGKYKTGPSEAED